jgi:hypothetical protein
MRFLCIPASSAAVERFFSGMGLVVSALRASLSSESLEALVYLRLNWDDIFYNVDYHAPQTTAQEAEQAEEPESEGEEDYVDEEEEEEEAEQVPDVTVMAAELSGWSSEGGLQLHFPPQVLKSAKLFRP